MSEKVLKLLQAHDPRGAEELLTHYGPLMQYIIAPILPDSRDREECLNEVVLRIWEKIDLYSRSSGSFTGTEYTFDAPLEGGSCYASVSLKPTYSYTVTAVISNGIETRLVLLATNLSFGQNSTSWTPAD